MRFIMFGAMAALWLGATVFVKSMGNEAEDLRAQRADAQSQQLHLEP